MTLRRIFAILLFTALCAGGAYADAFVWGPGDTPEEFQPLWDLESLRTPQRLLLDETDDSTGYDVRYYNIEIQFPTTTPHNIIGKVDMHFVVDLGPISQLNLNLRNNMTVDSARVNGTPVTWQFVGTDGLRLNLTSPLAQGAAAVATIWYHGVPVLLPPLQSGLAWGTHQGSPIIYSLSEPDGSHTWWPCKDVPWDKADSTRMVWTVPSNLIATGNGTLQSVTVPQTGWKSYEWIERYPMVNYLVVVTATNFAHFRNWYVNASNDSLPLDFYVFPEDSADAVLDFAFMDSVVAFFASIYGEYPYMTEKYGQAAFLWSGGEEHQTLTSVGASLITPSGNYHWLYVHEASHQWWGDMVTCETWMDIWLNEGFATYSDALWTEYSQGQTAFINRMNSFKTTYINSIPTQGSFPIYNPSYMWGGTVYQKGAWIMHMLRYTVGDSVFFSEFWPEYRSRFEYGNVNTAEFQQTIEDVSAQDLDWFFDEWVYKAGYPQYQWGWTSTPQGGQTLVNISVKQTQTVSDIIPIFNMPLPFRIVKNTGSETVTARDSLAHQVFSFLVDGTVTNVLFDPDNWVLKSATQGTYTPLPYTITMTPVNPPVQIPATGGSFNFNVAIQNTTATQQSFQAWILARLPNGAWQGPLLGPISLTLPAGAGITRARTQNVPAAAPAGNYLYEGRLGSYPQIINSAANFPFVKLTTGDSEPVADWLNDGDSFAPWTGAQAGAIPTAYALLQNYPNPFNPTTNIAFTLPEAAQVKIAVYDLQGRQIAELVNGTQEAGVHSVTWDASRQPSGLYFCRLQAGAFSDVIKIMLVK
jgi:hypothetical protein